VEGADLLKAGAEMNEAGWKLGCTGKVPFLTFKQADHRAKRMRQAHKRGCHVEAYHCHHCRAYHVGEAREYGARRARKDMER
jgi:hypothetical protein